LRSRSFKATVNPQLRYRESVMVTHETMQQGWLGEVNFMEFRIQGLTDWSL